MKRLLNHSPARSSYAKKVAALAVSQECFTAVGECLDFDIFFYAEPKEKADIAEQLWRLVMEGNAGSAGSWQIFQ